VLAVIGAGADYPVERYSPGRPVTELFGGRNGCWRGTASAGGYHTDTVLAVPTMYYGADGGLLFDDDHCDDYGPAGLPPAYVEVSFGVSNSRADAAVDAVDRLAAAVSVSAWWEDDYAAEWRPVAR
jgi:hypothetical protein